MPRRVTLLASLLLCAVLLVLVASVLLLIRPVKQSPDLGLRPQEVPSKELKVAPVSLGPVWPVTVEVIAASGSATDTVDVTVG